MMSNTHEVSFQFIYFSKTLFNPARQIKLNQECFMIYVGLFRIHVQPLCETLPQI